MKPKVKNEDRRQKFLRLAEERTNKVLQKIRVLGNCSNPVQYDYTEEDVKRIFSTIEKQLQITRVKFEKHKKEETVSFSFE